MSIGSKTRRLFGPYERRVTESYRAAFVDLDSLVPICSLDGVSSILEIGCGDGLLTNRLHQHAQRARIVGVDVCADPGRLFRGDRSLVRFFSLSTRKLREHTSERFDRVVICDVLHHVPGELHVELLNDAAELLAPTGMLIVKDWEPIRNLWNVLAHGSDRFITGDRVMYRSPAYYKNLIAGMSSPLSFKAEFRLPPRANNFALCFVKTGRG